MSAQLCRFQSGMFDRRSKNTAYFTSIGKQRLAPLFAGVITISCYNQHRMWLRLFCFRCNKKSLYSASTYWLLLKLSTTLPRSFPDFGVECELSQCFRLIVIPAKSGVQVFTKAVQVPQWCDVVVYWVFQFASVPISPPLGAGNLFPDQEPFKYSWGLNTKLARTYITLTSNGWKCFSLVRRLIVRWYWL